MSTTQAATALKLALNRCNPNALSDMLKTLGLGDVIRALPTQLRRKTAVASNPYDVATAAVLVLADDAKAAQIIAAYARAGTGAPALGPQTVDADGTAPADGHVSITPNGNINIGTSAKLVTDFDVLYLPMKQDIVEMELPCVAASGVAAIPAAITAKGVCTLLEAEGLVGTVVEKKIVLVPAAGAPATHDARLDVAKVNVQFAVADALTRVRVKLGIVSAIDVDALLEAASAFL